MPRKHSVKITFISSSMLICILQQLYRLWKWKKSGLRTKIIHLHVWEPPQEFWSFCPACKCYLDIAHLQPPSKQWSAEVGIGAKRPKKKPKRSQWDNFFFKNGQSTLILLGKCYKMNHCSWISNHPFTIKVSLYP